MKKTFAGLLAFLAALFLFGCGSSPAQPKEAQKEIYISAAASMADAVNEIKADYEKSIRMWSSGQIMPDRGR